MIDGHHVADKCLHICAVVLSDIAEITGDQHRYASNTDSGFCFRCRQPLPPLHPSSAKCTGSVVDRLYARLALTTVNMWIHRLCCLAAGCSRLHGQHQAFDRVGLQRDADDCCRGPAATQKALRSDQSSDPSEPTDTEVPRGAREAGLITDRIWPVCHSSRSGQSPVNDGVTSCGIRPRVCFILQHVAS